MVTTLLTVWLFRILLLGLYECKKCWWFPKISPCNSCSSPSSIFSRIWVLALTLTNSSSIISLFASFSTERSFSRKSFFESSPPTFTFTSTCLIWSHPKVSILNFFLRIYLSNPLSIMKILTMRHSSAFHP